MCWVQARAVSRRGSEVNDLMSPWCTFWHLRPRILLWCWKRWKSQLTTMTSQRRSDVSRNYRPLPTDLFFPVPAATLPSPIWGQCLGHVICLNQSQVSISHFSWSPPSGFLQIIKEMAGWALPGPGISWIGQWPDNCSLAWSVVCTHQDRVTGLRSPKHSMIFLGWCYGNECRMAEAT